jgi:hypothetical protein
VTKSVRVFAAMVVLAAAFGAVRRDRVVQAQGRQEPGRSIGTVSTQGDLIVLTLDEGALGT